MLKEQRRLQEALAHYKNALEIYPDHPISLNNIGSTLFAIGETIQAIEHLTKVIELDSNYAEAFNNLGNAYRHIKKLGLRGSVWVDIGISG